MMKSTVWICAKCDRVYPETVDKCGHCDREAILTDYAARLEQVKKHR